ncbi:MAG TPA: DUF4118 domain-containing protein, partial [Gemmatimonadaceae bacterium]|nr:DUF4118 domain-containing protein [Gemmatimonadaceae bacterium]
MSRTRALRPWLPWLGGLLVATLLMLAVRSQLDRAHATPLYLLLVVVASARAGRAVGLTLAVLAFVCLNFFFVPPYHTLVVSEPLDWLVLAAFLVTSAVAAQLLARAQLEAASARQRAEEVNRLSVVGAEALNAGRAEEALARIAAVIRQTLGLAACEVYRRDDAEGTTLLAVRSAGGDAAGGAEHAPGMPSGPALVEWVGANGRAVLERAEGFPRVSTGPGFGGSTAWPDLANVRVLTLPLRVGDRVAGVARLAAAAPLTLDGPQRRFLDALLYYATLGVERVRLTAEAEHAEALRQA